MELASGGNVDGVYLAHLGRTKHTTLQQFVQDAKECPIKRSSVADQRTYMERVESLYWKQLQQGAIYAADMPHSLFNDVPWNLSTLPSALRFLPYQYTFS